MELTKMTMDEYMEYAEILWHYLPYFIYTIVFLSFIPKSFRNIKKFADKNYEENLKKYHKCYAPELCCHALDPELLPKQKPRKAVTRVYPKKQQQQQQTKTKTEDRLTHSSSSSSKHPDEDSNSNVYKKQIHTNTNVNKIAKMFENGGVQKKINRVTPTVVPADFRRLSVDFDDLLDDDDAFFKNHTVGSSSQETAAKKKKDSLVTRRLSQLTQELENNENSSNILNQMKTVNEEKDPNWMSEPITSVGRVKRDLPQALTFSNGGGISDTTPSTLSPVHSSPQSSSPQSCSSPILRNPPAIILNMKSSLEDIFAAIAKSAESNDNFLYAANSLSPPVTSIDDILSQRRLSRPLSAYSISDLLNDETNSASSSVIVNNDFDETCVENFLQIY